MRLATASVDRGAPDRPVREPHRRQSQRSRLPSRTAVRACPAIYGVTSERAGQLWPLLLALAAWWPKLQARHDERYQARSPGGRTDLAWLSRSDLLTGLADGPASVASICHSTWLPMSRASDSSAASTAKIALTVHAAASLPGALTHVSYQLPTRRSGTQVRLCRCMGGRFPRRGRRHAAAANAPVCRVDSHLSLRARRPRGSARTAPFEERAATRAPSRRVRLRLRHCSHPEPGPPGLWRGWAGCGA